MNNKNFIKTSSLRTVYIHFEVIFHSHTACESYTLLNTVLSMFLSTHISQKLYGQPNSHSLTQREPDTVHPQSASDSRRRSSVRSLRSLRRDTADSRWEHTKNSYHSVCGISGHNRRTVSERCTERIHTRKQISNSSVPPIRQSERKVRKETESVYSSV